MEICTQTVKLPYDYLTHLFPKDNFPTILFKLVDFSVDYECAIMKDSKERIVYLTADTTEKALYVWTRFFNKYESIPAFYFDKSSW